MKIILSDITKIYDGRDVIKDFSYTFDNKSPTVIKGPSGIGKTTLIRIIEGLIKPDSGSVAFEGFPRGGVRFSPVFQDTRLIGGIDAVKNIRLAAPAISEDQIIRELSSLIPEDDIHKKARDLSGGTARRVEIVRAILSPSDIVIMDEPFTGLDNDNINKVCDYIKSSVSDRIFIASSHLNVLESFCNAVFLETTES